MSGKKLITIVLAFFVLELVVLAVFGGFSPQAEDDGVVMTTVGPLTLYKFDLGLENFQDVARWHIPGMSGFWSFNQKTVIMMVLIDILIISLAFMSTRKMKPVPGRLQSVFELIVDMFSDLVIQTLGEDGRRHIPMLGSLFLFLWISNIIGSVPMSAEPTRDLNVPIAHMVVVLTIVHVEAIRAKGLWTYLKSYNEPFFVMMPINVIGELAKGVSLAFRLFGNILGGAIIVMVISYLLKYTVIPVGLNMFFGIFVGTIQAFVFTTLSMTYLAIAIAD